MKSIKSLFFCALICFALSCNNNKSTETEKQEIKTEEVVSTVDTTTTTVIPEVKVEQPVISLDSSLTLLTKEILLNLKNKDYESFAKHIHPEVGCVFSPYGFIDTENARLLTQDKFFKLLKSGEKVLWGSYDGSGDPINLTLKAYFDKFVYNADYLNAEKFAVNKMLGSGNSLNNLSRVFPDLNYTESYFSGFKKEYSGMDWTTLRLVFLKSGSIYYLRAVVHDQWTT